MSVAQRAVGGPRDRRSGPLATRAREVSADIEDLSDVASDMRGWINQEAPISLLNVDHQILDAEVQGQGLSNWTGRGVGSCRRLLTARRDEDRKEKRWQRGASQGSSCSAEMRRRSRALVRDHRCACLCLRDPQDVGGDQLGS